MTIYVHFKPVLSNPCHLIWLRVSCCESRLPAYAVPDLDLEIKGGGQEVRSKGRQLYLQGTKLLALAITSGGQRRLFVNVIVIFNATLDYIISWGYCFPCKITSEERAQKRNTDEMSSPNLGGDASSVWNFCTSYTRHQFAGKPVVVSQTVCCFLTISNKCHTKALKNCA